MENEAPLIIWVESQCVRLFQAVSVRTQVHTGARCKLPSGELVCQRYPIGGTRVDMVFVVDPAGMQALRANIVSDNDFRCVRYTTRGATSSRS
jgi:hypothetical protein